MDRYLTDQVRKDLARKMVFVGGPRQVGKTTLARRILGKKPGYLNWDDPEDREKILTRRLPATNLWVFDELHKYRSWRNYLKGLYDKKARLQAILVTGSARLDLYRFGGDSLQGRYHYLRLHPLTVAELGIRTKSDLDQLSTLGGFPEPFLAGSTAQARRWSRDYRIRLIREDVVDLERVQDLGNLELLNLRLPQLVGSPLSVNALREDLQLSHKTISKWLEVFERLYFIFRVPPLGGPRLRAVKKAQKHYHFDWSLVSDEAARFENLVGAHLLKWVHFQQDSSGRDVELRYFRDVDGREVDFVVTDEGNPLYCVECKLSDAAITNGLHYLKARYPKSTCIQIAAKGSKSFQSPDGVRACSAIEFLLTLI